MIDTLPLRVDLRIDGRTLRGVRIQGAGGLIPAHDSAGLQRLRVMLREPRRVVRVYLTWTAETSTWIDTEAKNIELLGEAKPLLFRLGRNRPASERS